MEYVNGELSCLFKSFIVSWNKVFSWHAVNKDKAYGGQEEDYGDEENYLLSVLKIFKHFVFSLPAYRQAGLPT